MPTMVVRCPATGNGRTVAFGLPRPTNRQGGSRGAAAAEAQRADRQVQPEHSVLVLQRDAEELLDAAQTQVERLALEVQRARRLGLAPARRQVGLERLQ